MVKTFGERLKKLRKERRLTQDELAELLGTSKQVISRYETGQRTPKVTVAAQFAKALNVPLNYLMGEVQPVATAGNAREQRDVNKILEAATEQLTEQEGLTIDGLPASEEAIEAVLTAMQVGLAMAKLKNQENHRSAREEE